MNALHFSQQEVEVEKPGLPSSLFCSPPEASVSSVSSHHGEFPSSAREAPSMYIWVLKDGCAIIQVKKGNLTICEGKEIAQAMLWGAVDPARHHQKQLGET